MTSRNLVVVAISAMSLSGQRVELKTLESADAVVVGTVRSGTETAVRLDFELEVLRPIKGSMIPGSKISLQYPRSDWPTKPANCPEPCTLRLAIPVTGVFFLQAKGPLWTPLVTSSGPMVTNRLASLYIPAEQSLSSGAANLPNRGNWDVKEAFLAEIVSFAEGRSAGRISQLNQTFALEDRLAIPGLRAIRTSTLATLDVKDRALTLLIRRGYPGSFSDLVQSAGRIAKTSEYRRLAEALQSVRSTTSVVQSGLRSVFESPNSPRTLRYAAANALAEAHNKDMLPLFEAMLFSPDPILGVYGAVGIGMIANGCGISERDSGCVRDINGSRPAYWVPELHERQILGGFNPEKLKGGGRADTGVSFWQSWWRANFKVVLNDPSPR